MGRRRRPGLCGNFDADDLTRAYELGDRLPRQANGVIPRRRFHATRRQRRDGHLIPPSAVSVRMRVYCIVLTPLYAAAVGCRIYTLLLLMPPALRARIRDVRLPGLIVLPRVDGAVASGGGHAASRAVAVEAVEYLDPRTYADAPHCNAGPIPSICGVDGAPSAESSSLNIPAVASPVHVRRSRWPEEPVVAFSARVAPDGVYADRAAERRYYPGHG